MELKISHSITEPTTTYAIIIPDNEWNELPAWLSQPTDPSIVTQLRYLLAVAQYLTNLSEEEEMMDYKERRDLDTYLTREDLPPEQDQWSGDEVIDPDYTPPEETNEETVETEPAPEPIYDTEDYSSEFDETVDGDIVDADFEDIEPETTTDEEE